MFTIKIADIPVGVNNRFRETEEYCQDFIVDEEPIFIVPAEDMGKELKLEPLGSLYSDEELIIIHKRLIHKILQYDAFLMHAAVISVDGAGIAFAAKSGVGKTTRVKLWLKAFGERAKVINGDKPVLRFINNELIAFGTPWRGKEGLGSNCSAPLKAICFLERSDEVALNRLEGKDIIVRLFHQVLVPRKIENFDRLSALINKMLKTTPCFLLKCNRDKEDPKEIWEEMKGEMGI